jgi:hypothetical protein
VTVELAIICSGGVSPHRADHRKRCAHPCPELRDATSASRCCGVVVDRFGTPAQYGRRSPSSRRGYCPTPPTERCRRPGQRNHNLTDVLVRGAGISTVTAHAYLTLTLNAGAPSAVVATGFYLSDPATLRTTSRLRVLRSSTAHGSRPAIARVAVCTGPGPCPLDL